MLYSTHYFQLTFSVSAANYGSFYTCYKNANLIMQYSNAVAFLLRTLCYFLPVITNFIVVFR